MLPDETQEAFAKRVEEYFSSDSKGLRRSALWLLDAGHGEDWIIAVLRDAWSAGWDEGYFEGYDEGRDR